MLLPAIHFKTIIKASYMSLRLYTYFNIKFLSRFNCNNAKQIYLSFLKEKNKFA